MITYSVDAAANRVGRLAEEQREIIASLPEGHSFRAGHIQSYAAAKLLGVRHTEKFASEFRSFVETINKKEVVV